MADRTLASDKIEPVWDTAVTEYLTDEAGEMRAVKTSNLKDGSEGEIELKCVFVAIGHIPNSGFLKGVVNTDENGYIIQQPGGTRTNLENYSGGFSSDGGGFQHASRTGIQKENEVQNPIIRFNCIL